MDFTFKLWISVCGPGLSVGSRTQPREHVWWNRPAWSRVSWSRLLGALSRRVLSISMDGDPSAALGNLFQCLSTLIGFLYFNFCLLCLDLSLSWLSSLAIFTLLMRYSCTLIRPPHPFSLQAEQTQLLTFPLYVRCSSPISPVWLCAGLTPLFPHPVFGSPATDPALRMWPYQCWVEGQNLLSQHCGGACPNAVREAVGHVCHRGTVLAHAQFGVHEDPPHLFLQSRLPAGQTQPVMEHGISHPQLQDFAFPFAERCDVPVGPFLWHVEVPLNSSWNISCIEHRSQSSTICQLAEGVLCPIIRFSS